jgi:tRNA U34 5-methylaminomethyl-2-thiouridine-forming methyltransferase MnmC
VYNEELRPLKEVIICEDGTKTLYSKEFDEPYHSTKDGALHESLEKHVKPALMLKKNSSNLTIVDICFGLGYNTFSTIYYIKKNSLKTKVNIISPEFDEELISSLSNFDYPKEFDSIKHIIDAVSKEYFYEDKQFKVEIVLGDARESIPKIKQKVDIIYQDAFSPQHNLLLWTKEHFEALRNIAKNDAILTTYSIAAAIRLGLYENGFFIYLYKAKLMRDSTVASLQKLDNLEYIDMELKKIRNPSARSLRDFNL